MAESYEAWSALDVFRELLSVRSRDRIAQLIRPPFDENDMLPLFDSAGVPRFQTGDGQSFYNPPLVLKEVTSSYLNRIAVISVNQESVITLARRVCNASIARDITVLMVDLSFRSKSLTENKAKFRLQIRRRLGELKKATKTTKEKDAVADYSVKYVKDGHITNIGDLHEAYKDAYTAQTELLRGGGFMESLPECIEKIPNLNRLCFMQHRDTMESPETTDGKPVRGVCRELFDLNTKEGIEQYLVSHHGFSELETIEKGEEAGPETSRLFIDVLSACHSTQRQLRFLEMYCFPRRAHMPEAEEPSEAVWAGIEEVSKSLQSFALLTDASTPLREYTADSMYEMSHRHTRRFIKATLSSKTLQNIGLNFHGFGDLRSGDTVIRKEFPVETVLPASPSWPNLHNLDLRHFCIPNEVMVRLCNGVGNKLKLFFLEDVSLNGGEPKDITFILQGKIKRRANVVRSSGINSLERGHFEIWKRTVRGKVS